MNATHPLLLSSPKPPVFSHPHSSILAQEGNFRNELSLHTVRTVHLLEYPPDSYRIHHTRSSVRIATTFSLSPNPPRIPLIMAPPKSKPSSGGSKGKGKGNQDEGSAGGSSSKLKAANSINTRHILVRYHLTALLRRLGPPVLIAFPFGPGANRFLLSRNTDFIDGYS